MSTHETRDAGALLEDAVAAVILDELDRQRYTRVEIQHMSGINARTWINYFSNRSRSIPTPALAAVSGALGLTASKVLRRAEERIAELDATEAETLLGMDGRARMLAMRRYVRRPVAPAARDDLLDDASPNVRRHAAQGRADHGVEPADDAPTQPSKRPRRSA